MQYIVSIKFFEIYCAACISLWILLCNKVPIYDDRHSFLINKTIKINDAK